MKDRWEKMVESIESSLDNVRPGRPVPKPKLFMFRNAAGYTDREIAIADENYRSGAQFVLREVRMALMLEARERAAEATQRAHEVLERGKVISTERG